MIRPLLAFILITTAASAADFRVFLDAHCLDLGTFGLPQRGKEAEGAEIEEGRGNWGK